MSVRKIIPDLKAVVDVLNNASLSRYSDKTLIELYRLLYHAKINCNACEKILESRGIDTIDIPYPKSP